MSWSASSKRFNALPSAMPRRSCRHTFSSKKCQISPKTRQFGGAFEHPDVRSLTIHLEHSDSLVHEVINTFVVLIPTWRRCRPSINHTIIQRGTKLRRERLKHLSRLQMFKGQRDKSGSKRPQFSFAPSEAKLDDCSTIGRGHKHSTSNADERSPPRVHLSANRASSVFSKVLENLRRARRRSSPE